MVAFVGRVWWTSSELGRSRARGRGEKRGRQRAHFNKRRLQRCCRRWFAHSSAEPWPECWHIPRALGTTWRRAWPEGKPCRVSKRSKRVDAAPGLGARQKGQPSRLAGGGQGPPSPSPQGPPSRPPRVPALANPTGAVSKSPKMLGRAVQDGRMRPSQGASAGRRINSFSLLAWLCQSATLAEPWDHQRPRSRCRLPFLPRKCQAGGMPSLGVPLFANSDGKKKKGRVMAFWSWRCSSIGPRP